MTGAVAPNPHEGHRTEYLAQYVFASFGTAFAVQVQEDSGLDLYCTLNERIGQRSWPRYHYCIQVKSTLDPWILDGEESVKWLVRHPLPIFLCVLDKKELRIRLYHTQPRYYLWSLPPLPQRIELVPETCTTGRCVQWQGGTVFSLSAPILDFTMGQLADGTMDPTPQQVLQFWLGFDTDNLRRIANSVLNFRMPDEYEANQLRHRGWVEQGLGYSTVEQQACCESQMLDQLAWLSTQLYRGKELPGAVRAALLHRYLFSQRQEPIAEPDVHLQLMLNRVVDREQGGFLYRGIEYLGKLVDEALKPIQTAKSAE